MPTKKQLEATEVYANVMEEVKFRLTFIQSITSGESAIPSQLKGEICFLQLRMVCELVAIGCLVAHGDIPATQGKLQKEWAADKIISRLEVLHQEFFPKPFRQFEDGPNSRRLEPAPPGAALTQSELVDLYRTCGDVLHRGNLKKLLSADSPVIRQLPAVETWRLKLLHLLASHLFFLHDGSTQYICILWNKNDRNHRVQVAIAEPVIEVAT